MYDLLNDCLYKISKMEEKNIKNYDAVDKNSFIVTSLRIYLQAHHSKKDYNKVRHRWVWSI